MTLPCSPLRYPGGKASLHALVSDFIKTNKLQRRHYAEPYAGGCGLALALLYQGCVCDIHINDINKGIWAFWKCVLSDTESFADKIMQTPVTIKEWERQKSILSNQSPQSEIDIGFATFFLNRTNRSGIIENAGAIGGREQSGDYKINCRFNKDGLIRRIRRVSKYKNRIHLSNLDAVDFMKSCEATLPNELFFYIDPPYFTKGSSLYTNHYNKSDHSDVAEVILHLSRPWILTYDNVDEIKTLYSTQRQYRFGLNYSANIKRIGTELLIASRGLRIPSQFKGNQSHRPQYHKASD